jgi:hypothetical protein
MNVIVSNVLLNTRLIFYDEFYLSIGSVFPSISTKFKPPGSGSAFRTRIRIQEPIECGTETQCLQICIVKYHLPFLCKPMGEQVSVSYFGLGQC